MKKRIQHTKRSRELNSAELAQAGGSATLSVGNLLFEQETDNKIREMANETYVNR